MKRIGFVLTVCAAAVLFGCNMGNQGKVVMTAAQLPDGGKITVEMLTRFAPDGKTQEHIGPLAVWARPGQPNRTMVTLSPAPGSPTQDDQSSRIDVPGEAPAVCASKDGNRVWLVRNGKVVASFDYQTNVAILGLYAQPEWADPKATPIRQ